MTITMSSTVLNNFLETYWIPAWNWGLNAGFVCISQQWNTIKWCQNIPQMSITQQQLFKDRSLWPIEWTGHDLSPIYFSHLQKFTWPILPSYIPILPQEKRAYVLEVLIFVCKLQSGLKQAGALWIFMPDDTNFILRNMKVFSGVHGQLSFL